MTGIQFAPLNTPMRRRLQTLAAFAWIHLMMYGEILSLILYLYITIFTSFWWIGVVYGFYLVNDRDKCHTGGRLSKWIRNWTWWHLLRDFFPAQLVRTTELDPNKNYLFCVFPHGILSTGAFVSCATEAAGWSKLFPGIRPHVLTLTANFLVPIYREVIYALGCCSASAQSINYILDNKRKGHAGILIVGGAEESLYCHPGSYRIVLKKRKGFVKLAIKNGASLVPVLSFGETDIYDQPDNPEGSKFRAFQNFVKKFTGVAPAFPLGRGVFQYSYGIVPRRAPITTVVGAPIEVTRNLEPSNEEIQKLHSEFTEKLIELFNVHKVKYIKNHEKAELVIE